MSLTATVRAPNAEFVAVSLGGREAASQPVAEICAEIMSKVEPPVYSDGKKTQKSLTTVL